MFYKKSCFNGGFIAEVVFALCFDHFQFQFSILAVSKLHEQLYILHTCIQAIIVLLYWRWPGMYGYDIIHETVPAWNYFSTTVLTCYGCCYFSPKNQCSDHLNLTLNVGILTVDCGPLYMHQQFKVQHLTGIQERILPPKNFWY